MTLTECHHKYSIGGIDSGYGSVDLVWDNNNGTGIFDFLTDRIFWNVSYSGPGTSSWDLGLLNNGLVPAGPISPTTMTLTVPDSLALVNDGEDDFFFKAQSRSEEIGEECNTATITVMDLGADILPETKRYVPEAYQPNWVEILDIPEGAEIAVE